MCDAAINSGAIGHSFQKLYSQLLGKCGHNQRFVLGMNIGFMEKGFPVWWRGLGVWQDHVQTRPGATRTPGMALEPTLV